MIIVFSTSRAISKAPPYFIFCALEYCRQEIYWCPTEELSDVLIDFWLLLISHFVKLTFWSRTFCFYSNYLFRCLHLNQIEFSHLWRMRCWWDTDYSWLLQTVTLQTNWIVSTLNLLKPENNLEVYSHSEISRCSKNYFEVLKLMPHSPTFVSCSSKWNKRKNLQYKRKDLEFIICAPQKVPLWFNKLKPLHFSTLGLSR